MSLSNMIFTRPFEHLDIKDVKEAVKELRERLADDQGMFSVGVEETIIEIFGEKLI